MVILDTHIHAGAKSPFTLLHMTDTHLCRCDSRDTDKKLALAARRLPHFTAAETAVAEAIALSNQLHAPIVHTGDLTDFISCANLEAARAFADSCELLYTAGNHDFCLYVGEGAEDVPYRDANLPLVQPYFPNDMRFYARELHGVELVLMDDSYYQFDRPQLEALRWEIGKGLPILLFLHVPLYERGLYEYARTREETADLTGVPEPLLRDYPAVHYRRQNPDEITKETVRLITDSPQIKAIFAGHQHFHWECRIGGRMQYVTAGAGNNVLRRLTVD